VLWVEGATPSQPTTTRVIYYQPVQIYQKTRLPDYFLKIVPGTRCRQKIFENFFRSRNKVFGPVQIPKKTKLFLNLLLRFLWDLVTGLNPKSSIFSRIVPVLSPKEIAEKNSKILFWVFVPVQRPYF
jgi:hypothetical protein